MERIHWKVRPYVLTAGRTRTRRPLLVHTLVSVPNYDPVFATGLTPEARSFYELARDVYSIAELSALCGVSLGVVRVVLDDLVSATRVRVHSDSSESVHDHRLLERLRDGLRLLS